MRVARALEKLLRQREECQVIRLLDMAESDIPSVGRGKLERHWLSKFQEKLVEAFRSSHLIFLILPEYNWSTNPEVINVFHQLGSPDFHDCFHLKVFSTIGVSTGRGGRRPCIEFHILLHKIISFLDATGIVSPKIFESHDTENNISFYGDILSDDYRLRLEEFIDYTLRITARWNGKEYP